jgi:hypothetical protein
VRANAEVELVRRLVTEGAGPSAIAAATGIPRGTIRHWLAGEVLRRAHEDARPAEVATTSFPNFVRSGGLWPPETDNVRADERNVSIARRPDVAQLDEFVGPKR